MNESAAFSRFGLFALLIALLLGGCQAAPAGDPPLKGATMGGPFTLTAMDGRRVSDTDFAGKYRLVYFGFTFCPDVCPTDLATIGAGLRRFEESDSERAARVQPLFISVDPARDTPPVIARYVAAFHPRILGLTGSEDEVARVARAHAIFYERQPPATPGGDYLVDHTRIIVLYGPQGEPVAILPHDEGVDAFVRELERWVR
ncbi:MAG: SCO family protein [Sphingosinicella sp.]|uniref:SCO family protein n=1 Tax=Sphingosinicella sp. TaxID=1917971 RepID=UPI004037D801